MSGEDITDKASVVNAVVASSIPANPARTAATWLVVRSIVSSVGVVSDAMGLVSSTGSPKNSGRKMMLQLSQRGGNSKGGRAKPGSGTYVFGV